MHQYEQLIIMFATGIIATVLIIYQGMNRYYYI